MPTLRDVVGVLDGLYDPRWADSWDAVGTVAGDPDARSPRCCSRSTRSRPSSTKRSRGAPIWVVTHHPLWLKGVTSVAAASPKGRVIHTLISNGIALHTCHTNADSPPLGVSESMALALGLTDVRPLEADPADPTDTWVVFVLEADADRVAGAMHGAGAGAMGDYDSAQFQSTGTGSFRPLAGAGRRSARSAASSACPRPGSRWWRTAACARTYARALLAAHPYEEVAYDVLEPAAKAADRGSGRIGTPAETTLARSQRRSPTACRHITARPGSPATPTGGSHCGALRRLWRLPARAGERQRRRRLRDVGPAAPPGQRALENPGACAVVDVPHWGSGVDLAAGRVRRSRRATARHRGQGLDDRHRSLDLPRVVRADPLCAP